MVEAFSYLIRELRAEYGYRQSDLAEAIGSPRSVVTGWETNRQNPSRLLVDELAQRFGKYRSRLYVAARLLPLQLDAKTESKLCRALESAPARAKNNLVSKRQQG